ncbi:MAG: phosphoribosylanthranilate isomerase [Clostridiales bacterium]|nr:phosphoribosylanthranilate isomerase [Clostridiales bacterium]
MTKIKFCGLRREDDVRYAAMLNADFAGYIMSPKFQRYVSAFQVLEWKALLPFTTKTVGVFVDETLEYVTECAEEARLDLIQLHGTEDDGFITSVRQRTGLPVIKMIRPESEEDIKIARESSADYILLDSGVGGTGKTFNWFYAGRLDREYFLAGGLTPDNVGEAVRRLHPYAVDVSSGVENDGYKDFDRMNLFAKEVRINE